MMRKQQTCRVAVVALLALGVGAVSASAQVDGGKDVAIVRGIDASHPRYFTTITEVRGAGRSEGIMRGAGEGRCTASRGETELARLDAGENVDAEADVRSKIRIAFDRCWIRSQKVEGLIELRAWVQAGGSTREIEVPGYSEVGKERTPAPALIQSGTRLENTLRDLARESAGLKKRIDEAYAIAERAAGRADSAGRALAEATRVRESARTRLTTSSTAWQAALAKVTAAPDSAAQAAADSARRQFIADSIEVEAATRRIEEIRGSAAYQLRTTEAPQFIAAVQSAIREFRVGVAEPIGSLLANDGLLLRQMARFASGHPETIAAVGRELSAEKLDALLTAVDPLDQAAVFEWRSQVMVVNRHLERMQVAAAGALANMGQDVAFSVLLGDIRDAEILISQTGAKPDDVIVIQVLNLLPGSAGSRPFLARVRIREFGFVRAVSDAALLVHRSGVSSASREETIAAAEAEFVAGGRTEPVDVPLPANFIPAAGVNLAWTWYPRAGNRARTIARWLTPGFGLNVSFTSFQSQTVTFSPPEQPGGDVRRSVVPSKTDVQVIVGPVLTLFNNRVLLSTGWNLNVEQNRRYGAIGFSFVNIAKRLNPASDESP